MDKQVNVQILLMCVYMRIFCICVYVYMCIFVCLNVLIQCTSQLVHQYGPAKLFQLYILVSLTEEETDIKVRSSTNVQTCVVYSNTRYTCGD